MKYITIEWKLILKKLKNRKVIYSWIILLFMFIFGLVFNYSVFFNWLKYKIITQYSLFKVEGDINELSELRKRELTNEYNEKIVKLKKEYKLSLSKELTKISNIKTQYIKTIPVEYKKVLIDNNKTNYKELNFTLSKLFNISFKSDIYKLIIDDTTPVTVNDSILKQIDYWYRENKKDTFFLKSLPAKIDNNIKKTKKEDIKSESIEFNYKILEKKWNILLLDNKSLTNILPFGITFPSLFSYKAHWIGILPWYFDLHYWVDFKTTPYVYVNLYNFKNKQNKVIIADYSRYWNKMVLWNTLNNSSERFEYLHLNRFYVKAWTILKWWEKFWLTWKSWFITWPHLHFEYFKNWFYVPFDRGIDVDNKYLLKKTGFTQDEINRIIKLWKENAINMELVSFLYKELDAKSKKIDNLDLIVKVFNNNEKKNKYRLGDFIMDSNIKWMFWKKTTKTIISNVIKNVDQFHLLKKKEMLQFASQNKEDLQNIIHFDSKLLWKEYSIDINKLKINIEHKINYWQCKKFNSSIYNKYNNTISNKKITLTKSQINNINKITPLIYDYLQKNKIAEKLNDKLIKYNISINNCDLLFLELWKFYWETDFNIDNIWINWIFNSKSIKYKKNKILDNNDIKEQIKDSINSSVNKIELLQSLIKNKNNKVWNDFILKFWLWSFNWIIWQNPNEDYYVSNNLFNKDIWHWKNEDKISEVKDWTYTMAIKLYFNK